MRLIQWIVLGFLVILATFGDSIYTLQSTFYPNVAEGKNASTFQYTIVFGVFEGTVAIASPLLGCLNVNPKSTFITGSLLQGFSVMSFGLVNVLPTLTLFLSTSIILRILEGLGLSIATVGTYGLIPILFPEDKMRFIMGMLEICVPIGFLMGPIMGSFLYELGGEDFSLPFLVTGSSIMILTVVTIPIIITIKKGNGTHHKSTENEKLCPQEKDEFSIFHFLSIPSISVNFLVVFGMAVGFGFIFGILEPYLRHEFNSSQRTIAIIFGVTGVLYSVISPLVGMMNEDKMKHLPTIIIAGLILDVLGMSISGPLEFLDIEPNFIITCFGTILFGLGTGLATFSSYLNAMREARLNGFLDDSRTLRASTGLYMSCFSSGSMISSPISGFLNDLFGFRTALYFPVACLSILIIVVLLTKCQKQNHKGNYTRITGGVSQNSEYERIDD